MKRAALTLAFIGSLACAQTSPPQNSSPVVLNVKKLVRPDYPDAAVHQGIQGRVVVAVLIDEKGKVIEATVEHGDPLLADSAVRAIKKSEYEPPTQDGKPVRVRLHLYRDFAFSENVKDYAQSPPKPWLSEPSSGGKVVRVSSGVQAGQLVHQVMPTYPPEAKHLEIQGTVVLHAVIDQDGMVRNLVVVAGAKQLIQAAVGAVEQWRYKPYYLQGEPVSVDTTINVNFELVRR